MSTGQADQQTFNNELRGALFVNDKGDNPARPDYRGNCQVEGRKYRISGWKRTAKSGQMYLSLALTLDPAQGAPAPAQRTPADTAIQQATPVPDDDPPF